MYFEKDKTYPCIEKLTLDGNEEQYFTFDEIKKMFPDQLLYITHAQYKDGKKSYSNFLGGCVFKYNCFFPDLSKLYCQRGDLYTDAIYVGFDNMTGLG